MRSFSHTIRSSFSLTLTSTQIGSGKTTQITQYAAGERKRRETNKKLIRSPASFRRADIFMKKATAVTERLDAPNPGTHHADTLCLLVCLFSFCTGEEQQLILLFSRVAAMSVAKRVSEEMGDKLGGYIAEAEAEREREREKK